MNTTNNKMQFYIDSVNNGTRQIDTFAKTKRNFGTIVMPTGYGKSAYIFDDCIYNIIHKDPNKKLIICICSHILNLNAQTFMDFLTVLPDCNMVNNVLNNHKVLLVLNSSDTIDTYKEPVNCSNNIDEIKTFIYKDKKTNKIKTVLDDFNKSDYDIALISSCNKSLHKFINSIKNTKNIDIITYIDECHNIVTDNDEFSDNINFKKLVKNSYKCYGLSATPGNFVSLFNEIINKNKLSGNIHVPVDERIVNVSASYAINENIIIKPYVKYIHTSDGKLTAETILKCMDDAINSKNTKYNKLLVTCSTIPEARNLFNKCKNNFKCFKNTSEDDCKIKEFCDEVDTYEGNCIIFHCKKLIQGIDIKSISDCIITNNTNGDSNSKNRIIQIIGRCLRTNSGERGIPYDNRIKKYANVYILSNGNSEYDKNIAHTIIEYYGIDNILFDDEYGHTGSHPKNPLMYDNKNNNKDNKTNIIKQIKYELDELKLNLQNYIKTKIIPLYNDIIANGGKIDIQQIYKSCNFTELSDNTNTLNLFNETDKIQVIKNVFKQNNINI